MSNIKDNLNNSNVSESPSELSDVTSPLLEKGAIIADQEYHVEKQKNNILKKLIKPSITSMNDLLNFESGEESDSEQVKCLDDDPAANSTSFGGLEDDDTSIIDKVEDMVVYKPNVAEMHSVLEEELNQSWSSMSTTTEAIVENLSLEEVGHIR